MNTTSKPKRLSFNRVGRAGQGRRMSKQKSAAAAAGRNNLESLREKAKLEMLGEHFHFKPLVSEDYLKEWLDFPMQRRSLAYNMFMFPLRWMLWTNRSMASLEPTNDTIRERLCNTISVLSTAAGLFLVIAVTGLLMPPEASSPFDEVLVNIYGVLMYLSTISFCMYVCYVLIGLYPVIQSLRDDMAFQAFERYTSRWGGYELYFFNMGLHALVVALLVASTVLYSGWAVIAMVGSFFISYALIVMLCREMFLALDPISSMHLGLSNDPNDIYRAELMSRYLLKKVPNSLLEDEGVFYEQAEQQKAEEVVEEVQAAEEEEIRTAEVEVEVEVGEEHK